MASPSNPHSAAETSVSVDAGNDLDPLFTGDYAPTEETPIIDVLRLHPNLLAQLDAAFRRHHWLVTSSGAGAILDQHCRRSTRGRKKQGLDGALYYALQLTAVFATGQATVQQMYTMAMSLPLHTRLEFGLVQYADGRKARELTLKQLYTMTEGLDANLSYTADCLTQPERELPEEEQAEILLARQTYRHAVVNEIVTRLLVATHIVETNHGSYAIDDTAVRAWSKAPRESRHMPGGRDRPLTDEDTTAPATPRTGKVEARGSAAEPDEVNDAAAGQATEAMKLRRDPHPWLCPDADWGGKTSKSGKQVGIYGYKAHVIVNTNDPQRKENLPVLIQAMELTAASTDIVDVSLRLIDQIRERAPFERIIGDRHYGYKKLERWAMELWRRRIHQVLDLRADKPGAVDQYGAKIIDGRPHCPGMATHLEVLSPSEDRAEQATFRQQINHREKFALRMVKGPLASPTSALKGEADPKVGITRWQCPAAAGQVGCSLRTGTLPVARELGLSVVPDAPVADENGGLPKCCTQETIQIRPDQSMKYLQEDYWGGDAWTQMYALRSAVEAVFGNIKNRGTEDVRRGYMQVTGLPLVTLAVTAAAVCYNIRIIEKYSRESGENLDHPLTNHPLDDELIESLLIRGQQVIDFAASHDPIAA